MKIWVCRALSTHIKIPLHGGASFLIVVYRYMFNISCDSAGIEIDSGVKFRYWEKYLFLPVQVCPGNYQGVAGIKMTVRPQAVQLQIQIQDWTSRAGARGREVG